MGVTVHANPASVVHKPSHATSIGFPDVCRTTPPAVPVPIPYPNTATTALRSQQQTQARVKTGGGAVAVTASDFRMTGDEAGLAGAGVISSTTKASAEFAGLTKEASNVARLEAMQLRNSLNHANARLQALRTRDPKEWQKVLTEYAVLASALYRTLYPDD
jgi:hypothetical protein